VVLDQPGFVLPEKRVKRPDKSLHRLRQLPIDREFNHRTRHDAHPHVLQMGALAPTAGLKP